MIHEMNLFRLAQNICPTLTLKNYVEFDKDKKTYVKNDLTLYPLEYFKEDKDSIEFSTYSFVDCDYIHEIEVVFPAYYAHSGWVKAGELTKAYKVAYVGQKLETKWSASQDKSVCITYCFKKIDSYGYAHWDFNEDDNVKKYFKDLKETITEE